MKIPKLLKCIALAGLFPLAVMAQTSRIVVSEDFSDGDLTNSVYDAGNQKYTSLSWGVRHVNNASISSSRFHLGHEVRATERQQIVLAQFKQQAATISNVNDFVSMSFDVSFTANTTTNTFGNSANGLRIGLLNSGTAVISGAGTGSDYTDNVTGYIVDLNLGAPEASSQLKISTRSATNGAILNSSTAFTSLGTGADAGSTPVFGDGVNYHMVFSMMKLSDDSMRVSFDVFDSGGSTKLLSLSVIDTGDIVGTDGMVTSFDMLGFYRGTSSVLEDVFISNLEVSMGTAIPEPGTYAAIMGAAILAFALYRRRRR